MTDIDEQTIEKIANAVKNRNISDRWKDPKSAERWGSLGYTIALIAGLIAFLSVAGAVMFSDIDTKWEKGDIEYQKISLANMDCSILKKTLLDLEASEEIYVPSSAVEKQITARC